MKKPINILIEESKEEKALWNISAEQIIHKNLMKMYTSYMWTETGIENKSNQVSIWEGKSWAEDIRNQ